jgi:hypothetical protein
LNTKKDEQNGTFSMFAVSLNYMDFTYFYTMFYFSSFTYSNQSYTTLALKLCAKKQWKLLGDNYETIFQ